MDFASPARRTPRTAPARLLHGLAVIDEKHAVCQCPGAMKSTLITAFTSRRSRSKASTEHNPRPGGASRTSWLLSSTSLLGPLGTISDVVLFNG
jgi:hypothetical protein